MRCSASTRSRIATGPFVWPTRICGGRIGWMTTSSAARIDLQRGEAMTIVPLGHARKKRTLVEAHMPPRADTSADILPLRGLCPWSDDSETDYDRRHLALYTCLIDGDEQGASLEEMAAVVF